MTETIIPDPVLIERLQRGADGIEWAAALVQPYQHEPGHDDWTANRDVWHLIDTERYYLQPRLSALLQKDEPDLRALPRMARPEYAPDRDIVELAQEFLAERGRTLAVLNALAPWQWARTGRWAEDRVVDVAWLAERILWHGLDHLAVLLRIHNEFESRQSERWRGGS
jgi:hypothetical protein